ncbi:MAG: DUF2924 domain-containing protein [Rhodobacteraceae bacterium]|nr:DUF2924 domain-containing protein [Paracoccaceae bacterium]
MVYGGLKPETFGGWSGWARNWTAATREAQHPRDRERRSPARGLREWQGVEQIVTVTADGFEWQGRPYKSLSAIARAITGTRWNGGCSSASKNHRGRT